MKPLTIVLLLAALFGTVASAQTAPFTCAAIAAVPPTVRAEGLSELTGDVLLDCTGGVPAASGSVNFTLFFNTNVTSRILDTGTQACEALLLVDEPQPGTTPLTPGQNLYQGVCSGNRIDVLGVQVVPPGNSGHRIYRFTNARVNASAIPPTGGGPGTIQSLISATGSISVPINVPTQVVGYTQFGLSNPKTYTIGVNGSLNQGIGLNSTVLLTQTLSFSEGIPTAFRRNNAGTTPSDPTAVQQQNMPGAIYNTESGFFDTSLTAAGGLNQAGRATQGTRFFAKFDNVPTGVDVWVTAGPLPGGSVASSDARLMVTDQNGSGAWFPMPNSRYMPVTLYGSGTPVNLVKLAEITNGTGVAVWEVLKDNPIGADSFSFGLLLSYSSQSSSSFNITTRLAPLSASATADSTSPVPRFSNSAINYPAGT
ncbi:MAG: hypothetical protein M1541_10605, partial [Acidobacteria bacterium]|nr:hypothetical protein [Acidobacteriota bacterium]